MEGDGKLNGWDVGGGLGCRFRKACWGIARTALGCVERGW